MLCVNLFVLLGDPLDDFGPLPIEHQVPGDVGFGIWFQFLCKRNSQTQSETKLASLAE